MSSVLPYAFHFLCAGLNIYSKCIGLMLFEEHILTLLMLPFSPLFIETGWCSGLLGRCLRQGEVCRIKKGVGCSLVGWIPGQCSLPHFRQQDWHSLCSFRRWTSLSSWSHQFHDWQRQGESHRIQCSSPRGLHVQYCAQDGLWRWLQVALSVHQVELVTSYGTMYSFFWDFSLSFLLCLTTVKLGKKKKNLLSFDWYEDYSTIVALFDQFTPCNVNLFLFFENMFVWNYYYSSRLWFFWTCIVTDVAMLEFFVMFQELYQIKFASLSVLGCIGKNNGRFVFLVSIFIIINTFMTFFKISG